MATIRPMTVRDLEAVLRLEVSAPEAPHWQRSTYETLLSRPGAALLFVAEDGVGIVGFLIAQAVADLCELESIVVNPAARRNGIGKTLFAELVNSAIKLDLSRIQLEVRRGNNSAIAFYHTLGFRQDGFRRNYYRNPDEDAVLMGLVLKTPPKSVD